METKNSYEIEKIYENKLQQESQTVELNFPSGTIIVCETGQENDSTPLTKTITPGTYKTDIYYLNDEILETIEELPTLGINCIVINFNDNPISTWEEIMDEKAGPHLDGDMINFLITDQSSVEEIGEQISDIVENCYTDGFETSENDLALIAYIGEVATEHRLYWALDADGSPVKLVAYFRYPQENNIHTLNN